jgi:hypothetical protein
VGASGGVFASGAAGASSAGVGEPPSITGAPPAHPHGAGGHGSQQLGAGAQLSCTPQQRLRCRENRPPQRSRPPPQRWNKPPRRPPQPLNMPPQPPPQPGSQAETPAQPWQPNPATASFSLPKSDRPTIATKAAIPNRTARFILASFMHKLLTWQTVPSKSNSLLGQAATVYRLRRAVSNGLHTTGQTPTARPGKL